MNNNWKKLSLTQVDFLNAALKAAQACQRATGVLTSITVAQAILESDFGRCHLGDANNYFGIKHQPGDGWVGPSVEVKTKEWSKKRGYYTIVAKFRSYKDIIHSFTDHGLFLKKPRYISCFGKDYRGFAIELQRNGYATDPAYANKLIKIVEFYGLQYYDLAPGQ